MTNQNDTTAKSRSKLNDISATKTNNNKMQMKTEENKIRKTNKCFFLIHTGAHICNVPLIASDDEK